MKPLKEFKDGQEVLLPVTNDDYFTSYLSEEVAKIHNKYIKGTIIAHYGSEVLVAWKEKDKEKIASCWKIPASHFKDYNINEKYKDFHYGKWINSLSLAKSVTQIKSSSSPLPLVLSMAALGLLTSTSSKNKVKNEII